MVSTRSSEESATAAAATTPMDTAGPVEIVNDGDMIKAVPVSDEDFERAQKTFQQGKKNLLLNKYDESVTNIEEACKVYSAKYGELDPQCADVYFFFGRALLELARVENTVLGNALNGVPEDTGPINDSRYGNPDEVAEDEKEDIADKVIDAMCENNEAEGVQKEQKDEPAKSEENGEKPMESIPAAATEPAKEVEMKESEKKSTENGEEKEAVGEEDSDSSSSSDEGVEGENEVGLSYLQKSNLKSDEEDDADFDVKKAEEALKDDDDEESESEEDEEEEDLNEKNDEDMAATKEEGSKEAKEEEAAKEGGEEVGDENEEEDEEISNLQRSWEMFELAKVIYQKNFNDDMAYKNRRIAECLLKLGEIGIEQEMYEQAINDIRESIRIQEEQIREERDERMLAESYYQLGLAQQFHNLFPEANESYQRSINILQIRVEKLKGRLIIIDGMAEQSEDSKLEKNTINDEIAELELLLPELNGKLEEVNEQGQQSLNLIKEAKECFINSVNGGNVNGGDSAASSFAKSTTTNGDCKDITSLMKRKISQTEELAIQKKTRLSNGGNAENGKMEAEQATSEAAPESASKDVDAEAVNV